MAEEKSVEDRVADLVLGEEQPEESLEAAPEAPEEEITEEIGGDEGAEQEAAEDDSEAPEGEFVEVEFEGQLYEVPTVLKDALLRQTDYTQKTQDVATQRKAAEVQIGELETRKAQFEFAESVWDETIKVQQLDETAKQWQEYLRSNIDTLSSTDIEKIRFQVEETRTERDNLANEILTKQQGFQQSQQQAQQELLNKGTEVLRQRIPGWGEDQQKQVRDFGLGSGFTEQELSTVVDPRMVEVLFKASQYDALKEGAAPAIKKVQEAPAIKTKARTKMPEQTKRMLNTRKKLKSANLSDKQKADVIRENIADRLNL
jgi:hypothetical protein